MVYLARLSRAALLLSVLIGAMVFVLSAAATLTFPYPLNYSEDAIIVMAAELLAGRGAVRIKTTDDAKAAEIISSLTWVSGVTSGEDGLVITVPPERSSEIAAALSAQGVHIREMAALQESLEDYFLEVTRDDPPTSEGEVS